MKENEKEKANPANIFHPLQGNQPRSCRRMTYIQLEMMKVSSHSFLEYHKDRG